jgi:hypothetical protein
MICQANHVLVQVYDGGQAPPSTQPPDYFMKLLHFAGAHIDVVNSSIPPSTLQTQERSG